MIDSDDGPKKKGFYTTRFVEADSPEVAEKLSVELIKNDTELQNSVLNDRSDPPMIYLESLEELNSFGDNNVPGSGYTFYPEEGEK